MMVISKQEDDMTKTQEIKTALEAGAKVVVGLHTFRGAADVAKFSTRFSDDEAIKYQQVRFYFPGVKYRTHYRAAH